jgi:WD40 repeat protein
MKRNRAIRILLILLTLAGMTVEMFPQVLMPDCQKVTPLLVLSDANSPSLSADGRRIAVSPSIGLDEVYDVASGRKLQSFRVPNSFGSQLSANGKQLAIFAPLVSDDPSSRPCNVLFFDVDSGREIKRSNTCVKLGAKFLGSIIIDNANNNRNLSSDLRLIAGPASRGSLERRALAKQPGIWLWDIANQRLDRTFGEFVVYDEYNFDTWKEVRLTPDGRVLAATRFNRRSENLETVVWDTQSGSVLLRLPFASRSLALSDNGRRVAATREPPIGNETNSVSLAVNPRGQVVANSSGVGNSERPPTEVWDIETKKRVAEIGEYRGQRVPITGFAFSPDGKLLATESVNCVLVWDADTGKLRTSLLHNEDYTDRVRSVAFSSDGRYLVASSSNELVKVWTIADLRVSQ